MKRLTRVFCYAAIAAPLSIAVATAHSATYYIDYSAGSDSNRGTSVSVPWKHAPGMTGFSGSYTYAAGDTFVFKGGVTWTASFPWTFRSGASGSPIIYTTDHTWYSGANWSQPIFDDGHANPRATGMAQLSNAGYLTINDLDFTSCGTSGNASDNNKCLVFENTHDITITNSTFTPYDWINIYFVFDAPGSYSNFTVTGNDFSHTTGAIWVATTQANTTIHNFKYDGNTAHDYSDMMGGGAHGDGFLHYFNSPYADSTQYMDGFEFCDNHSYGDFTRGITGSAPEDMTGLIYFEGGVNNGLICNNLFTWTPGQNSTSPANIFEAVIDMRSYGNPNSTGMKILNNVVYGAGGISSWSGSAALLSDQFPNSTIENNIIVFGTYCAISEYGTPTSMTDDYNDWECPLGYQSWTSQGAHDISGDPVLANPPSDDHLTSGSPGVGKGINLTSLGIAALDSDYAGAPRPSVGAWDMGAYNYGSSTSSPRPNPPTKLTGVVK
jgi:hypothetical protein